MAMTENASPAEPGPHRWFVVANGSRARAYVQRIGNPGYDVVREWDSPEARMTSAELGEDRPGRVFPGAASAWETGVSSPVRFDGTRRRGAGLRPRDRGGPARMHPVVVLAISMGIPFACLGLLLWLAWLEDTLEQDVKRTERHTAPAPVLAVPVRESRYRSAAAAAQPLPDPREHVRASTKAR